MILAVEIVLLDEIFYLAVEGKIRLPEHLNLLCFDLDLGIQKMVGLQKILQLLALGHLLPLQLLDPNIQLLGYSTL